MCRNLRKFVPPFLASEFLPHLGRGRNQKRFYGLESLQVQSHCGGQPVLKISLHLVQRVSIGRVINLKSLREPDSILFADDHAEVPDTNDVLVSLRAVDRHRPVMRFLLRSLLPRLFGFSNCSRQREPLPSYIQRGPLVLAREGHACKFYSIFFGTSGLNGPKRSFFGFSGTFPPSLSRLPGHDPSPCPSGLHMSVSSLKSATQRA